MGGLDGFLGENSFSGGRDVCIYFKTQWQLRFFKGHKKITREPMVPLGHIFLGDAVTFRICVIIKGTYSVDTICSIIE